MTQRATQTKTQVKERTDNPLRNWYLFTDYMARDVLEVKQFEIGADAMEHRSKMEAQRQEVIIAWCHMGMNNPRPQL